MIRAMICAMLLLTGLSISVPVRAHGGGTNADGCHNNRKTGDYHCHGAKASAPRSRTQRQGFVGGASFRNCSEARAAGAAPVRRGDPRYASHLDRDNDGVGCE